MEIEMKSAVIDKLEGQYNWIDWKFQVRIQLQAHGVMRVMELKWA